MAAGPGAEGFGGKRLRGVRDALVGMPGRSSRQRAAERAGARTGAAHELERTHDWVVICFKRDHTEQQCTVVTARSGPLAGRRVVRGRESECREYHAGSP